MSSEYTDAASGENLNITYSYFEEISYIVRNHLG